MSEAHPVIPGYVIREMLGRGSMGTVYRATQSELGRDVALKVLHASVLAGEDLEARFDREIALHGGVSHPNLVKFLDAGQYSGGRYLAMELALGGSLKKLADREPLPLDRITRVCLRVARAVEHLHRSGILHRDIKPANILVTLEGEVKLADYGLARGAGQTQLTSPGSILGTPPYLAPEILAGCEFSHASDVHAMGVTMYELVACRLPFRAPTLPLLITSIQRDTPPPLRGLRPGTPDWLEEVVSHCLRKDPSRRPDVRSLIEELERREDREDSPPLSGSFPLPSRGGTASIDVPDPVTTITPTHSPVVWTGGVTRRVSRQSPLWFGGLLLLGLTVAGLFRRSPGTGPDGAAGSSRASSPIASASITARDWLGEYETRWLAMHRRVREVRGWERIRMTVPSADHSGEFELQRHYRDLLEITIDALWIAEHAPAAVEMKITSGYLAERTVKEWALIDPPATSTLVTDVHPRLLELVRPRVEDPLVEGIRRTLRHGFDHWRTSFSTFGARLDALLELTQRLGEGRPTRLHLLYQVECLDSVIVITRFKDRSSTITGLEESPRTIALRRKLLAAIVGGQPRWPADQVLFRHGIENAAALIVGDECGPEDERAGLLAAASFCPGIPTAVRGDVPLTLGLVTLHRALEEQYGESSRSPDEAALSRLEECLRQGRWKDKAEPSILFNEVVPTAREERRPPEDKGDGSQAEGSAQSGSGRAGR